MSTPSYAELAHELIHEFGSMHKNMTSRMSNAISGEMAVMRALLKAGTPLTPSQLADGARISAPRVANILRSLENKGWITREHDKTDRRRVLVKITDLGYKTLEERRRLFDQKTGEFLAELGIEDAQELIRLLQRMNQIIDKNDGARIKAILSGKTADTTHPDSDSSHSSNQ